MPPEICPHCGAEVPPKAKRCPECGSDEETGWSDDASSQNLGLADEENFDYDEFVKRELEGKNSSGLKWYWVVAAILALAGVIAFFIL